MQIADTQPSSELALHDQMRHLLSRIRVTWRYAWVGVLIVALFTGVSVLLAVKSKRKFTSKAVVLYRQMIEASDIGTERRGGSFLDLGTQLQEILLTRPRLTQIIKEYDLYPKTVAGRGYDPAVDELRKNLQFLITAGNTIHLQYNADSPKVAQAVVAWLTKSLVEEESRQRIGRTSAAAKFLEGERKRAVEDLHTKEQALATFLAKHPEFVADTASQSPAGAEGALLGTPRRATPARRPAAARASVTDRRLLALQRQAARIRAQLTAQPAPVVEPPPMPVDTEMDTVLRAVSEEVREAKRQLEQRQAQYTELHPDVKAARQRLAEAQARLKRLKQIVRPVVAPRRPPESTAERENLTSELAKINREIEARRWRRGSTEHESDQAGNGVADGVVALEMEWTTLNREAAAARGGVLSLEGRQFRASLAASSEQSQASQMEIIDPAFLPTQPSGRGRTTMVLIGFAAGVFLAGIVLLGLAFLDDRIYDRTDIQRLRLVPLLIVLPKAKKKRA